MCYEVVQYSMHCSWLPQVARKMLPCVTMPYTTAQLSAFLQTPNSKKHILWIRLPCHVFPPPPKLCFVCISNDYKNEQIHFLPHIVGPVQINAGTARGQQILQAKFKGYI